MTQEIYGWHIIHAETGMPLAFCAAGQGDLRLTEADVLEDFPHPEKLALIPLVRAGVMQ